MEPKMITIRAKLLKWCPYGFEMLLGRSKYSAKGFFSHREKGKWVRLIGGNGISAEGAIVDVDAGEYEKACIDRIKEMFNGEFSKVISIKKAHCDGVVVIMNTPSLPQYKKYGEKDSGTFFTKKSIWVNCDPRPHEQSYVIEVA